MPDFSPEYIKTEFDCFVRIGGDPDAREQLSPILESYTDAGLDDRISITISIELHDDCGEVAEIFSLDTDHNQLVRLRDFLRRFSVDEVRLIGRLMGR